MKRLAPLAGLFLLACAHAPTTRIDLISQAGWGMSCGSIHVWVEANETTLARVMRVLDAHARECTGDVCIVHGVSMRAMEHAMDGVDENSVEARMGGGAYGVGDVVIQFVVRDGRPTGQATTSSPARDGRRAGW